MKLTSKKPGIQIYIGIFSILFVLLLDSKLVSQWYSKGQLLANIIMCCCFVSMFHLNKTRIKYFMILMIIITYPIEYLCAIKWNIYNYRLNNLPIYVPLGHAVIYITAYQIIQSKRLAMFLQKYRSSIELSMLLSSFIWFLINHDVFGFICTILYLSISRFTKRINLFFFCMFIIVILLEITGTILGNWQWFPTIEQQWDILPRGNPPFGVAVVYFLFDLTCLMLYCLLKPKIAYKIYRISWFH